MPSKEPVILAGIAKIFAAVLVAVAAKHGLNLDTTEVVGLLVAVEMAIVPWARSKVSPVKA